MNYSLVPWGIVSLFQEMVTFVSSSCSSTAKDMLYLKLTLIRSDDRRFFTRGNVCFIEMQI